MSGQLDRIAGLPHEISQVNCNSYIFLELIKINMGVRIYWVH